jgi:hypothetical protein
MRRRKEGGSGKRVAEEKRKGKWGGKYMLVKITRYSFSCKYLEKKFSNPNADKKELVILFLSNVGIRGHLTFWSAF